MIAADLSIPALAVRGGSGPQQWLGPALLAMWDAERPDLLNLAGGGVAAWTDMVAGCPATQASPGARPGWSATGFGGRPGVSFDGVDDWLIAPSAPVPAGGNGCELWLLARQDSPPVDAGDRYPLSLGGAASVTYQVRIARTVVAGVNRAAARVGDGTTNELVATAAADFSGVHVVRACFGPGTRVAIDGQPATGVARGPGSVGNSVAIGATVQGAGNFKGVINAALVTRPLSDALVPQLLQFLRARGAGA